MQILKITIDGPPVRQQRHRISKWGGMYDPSSKERKALAKSLMVYRKFPEILTNRLALTARFYLPKSKGRKSDLSNYLKALEDAGNGVLWKDDSQIIEEHLYLIRDAMNPRTELEVYILEPV